MKYKLVVLDLDGTLLNDEHEVSRENRTTISCLKKQGVQFMLASGRPYKSIVPYAMDLGLDLPIISANGSIVKSPKDNDVYVSSSLPKELAKEIIDFAKEQMFSISLYLENNILTFNDDLINLHRDLEKLEARKITRFLFEQPIFKILLVHHPKKIKETLHWLGTKYKNKLHITSSEQNFIEVMNINASKGIALKHLMKKMGLPSQEAIVFGNNFNDVSMFEIAGLSVAMLNSPYKVRNIADIVTKSNVEDGVAYALKKIFLGGFSIEG